LRISSAFYPCVGIGKTLYSERLIPRNYGGTLTGEDVVCIPCINDTNHDTVIREQCVFIMKCRALARRPIEIDSCRLPIIAKGIVTITVFSYGVPLNLFYMNIHVHQKPSSAIFREGIRLGLVYRVRVSFR